MSSPPSRIVEHTILLELLKMQRAKYANKKNRHDILHCIIQDNDIIYLPIKKTTHVIQVYKI